MKRQTPIFVVSSGRAGATLLAKMVHRHPRLLCVSDLFEPVGEIPYFDRKKQVSGEQFLAVLSSPSFKQRIAFWRDRPTSELLFLPEDDDMVSLLVSYALPFLDKDDPMGLFHQVKKETEARGLDSMADHLISFFDSLRDRYGKELWVERTGGSLPHMKKIIETWPDAKIIHNYRDPRETAISMMTGSFFRLYLELAKNPDLGDWDFDHMPPLEEMGAMLNQWVVDGVAALAEVPAERRLNLAYEDLLDDAAGTLSRLHEFIFEAPPDEQELAWATAESAIIRRPPLKFPKLSNAEQQRLGEVCAGSLAALGYS